MLSLPGGSTGMHGGAGDHGGAGVEPQHAGQDEANGEGRPGKRGGSWDPRSKKIFGLKESF